MMLTTENIMIEPPLYTGHRPSALHRIQINGTVLRDTKTRSFSFNNGAVRPHHRAHGGRGVLSLACLPNIPRILG